MAQNEFHKFQKELAKLGILTIKDNHFKHYAGAAKAIKDLSDVQLDNLVANPFLSRYTGTGDTNLFRILTNEQKQRDRHKQFKWGMRQYRISIIGLIISLIILGVLIYKNFLNDAESIQNQTNIEQESPAAVPGAEGVAG